jgi:hypothetical protein
METKTVGVVKRQYTKRGTTVPGKRVVLLNGVPVGRGKPAKNGKGKRTVVFVPMGEVYDVIRHGTGTEFRSKRHGVLRRLKVKDLSNSVVNLGNEVVKTYDVEEHEALNA